MGSVIDLARSFGDSLTNLVSRMGTERDKASQSYYGAPLLNDEQIINAYRGSWLSRKIIDIPALDSCRKWRNWQADPEQIEKIEAEEKRLNVRGKVLEARIKARLFGGAAILIGTGEADTSIPLDVDRLTTGSLKYLTVLTRRQLNAVEIDSDPASEWYGRPQWYTVSGQSRELRVHASRLVIFQGNETAADDLVSANATPGWGDSVLIALLDAIKNADATASNIASLVFEAKVDVIRIPNFMSSLNEPGYEQSLLKRYSLANAAKGINGTLILDKEEEYESKSASFSTLPEILDRFLQIASGAADIPATRLLGQSPAGMNSTGTADMKNYHDRIQASQELEMTPAMWRMDECLIRSALGSRDPAIWYTWAPLEQMSEREKADILKTTADAARTIAGTGGASPELIPIEALSDALVNALVEQGVLPGLEAAIEEFGRLSEQEDDEDDTAAAVVPAPAIPNSNQVADAEQPRVPAGGPRGGQWTKVGATGGSRLRGGAAGEEELSAVGDYIQEASEINHALRTSGIPRHREDEVELLDGLIQRSQLTSDTDLYRGLTPEAFKAISPQKGKTFEDKAFVSTSRSKRIAQQFSENFASGEMGYVMRIFARKGTTAADISELSGDGAEQEVLMPRGQKFKVMDVNEARREVYVHAV